MKNFEFSILEVAPSQGINPQIIQDQFNWRRTLKWESNKSQIAFGDVKECFWWNRPIGPAHLVKQEADGLYSYNLPYIGPQNRLYKTGYNILVTPNTIPIVTHIKINPKWTNTQITRLEWLMSDSIYTTLIELGVDSTKLTRVMNDLLYDNKKFVGIEQKTANGVFSQDIILTLKYKPEEEIFKRLTGKYALARGIIGIMEETNCFTREQFIETLKAKILKVIDSLD
jgi:hypothetical protein